MTDHVDRARAQARHRVITPVCRLSFPQLFEPVAFSAGQEKRYQCDLIFEPGESLEELNDALEAAVIDKWGCPEDSPDGLRLPVKRCDLKDADGYANGCYYVSARSKNRPSVVDAQMKVITDPSAVYGGCYVRASVTCNAYKFGQNAGVSLYLNNVMKVKEGDPFGSGRSAAEDFGEFSVPADPSAPPWETMQPPSSGLAF